jgi:hypothetical protein
MTSKEIDGMMSHQCWRLYNVLQLQQFRVSKFSDGMFCFLETPVLTEKEQALVNFLPGQQLSASSNIFWKFFVSSNDVSMKAVPRDWRVLSRHASGISSDMILQPFVSEIIKSLYQHQEGFDQFHLDSACSESCAFSLYSTLQGKFEAGARITLLKIVAEVVVKGEFKLEFLATVDVGALLFRIVPNFNLAIVVIQLLMQVGNSKVADLQSIEEIFAVVNPILRQNFTNGLVADFSTSSCFVEGSIDEGKLQVTLLPDGAEGKITRAFSFKNSEMSGCDNYQYTSLDGLRISKASLIAWWKNKRGLDLLDVDIVLEVW